MLGIRRKYATNKNHNVAINNMVRYKNRNPNNQNRSQGRGIDYYNSGFAEFDSVKNSSVYSYQSLVER